MTVDDHNHFCIYCGAKLVPDQNFCSQCGREVLHEKAPEIPVPSKYDDIINQIEQEYDIKQKRAKELVAKLFNPNHMAYNKFSSSIDKSNQLFNNQLEVTKKMIELDTDNNEIVEDEIDNKIKTLQTFIDKMEDLINELVINLSTNKKDNDDINNLFNDMDDLIDSVKDY
ncbi:zinc-ribbon domain-containing protein [Methanobrevibacter sp.]